MRKRKFHIISYPGSSWAACGAQCQHEWKRGSMLVHNGIDETKLKSPCKITCKLCRKNWLFRKFMQRRATSRAT